MRLQPDKKYFIASCVFHTGILLALILSYEFSRPLAVIENTNEHDVISAVILGDTAKSKILPHEAPATKPVPPPKPEPVKKEVAPPPKKVEVKKMVDPDVIALKAAEKKVALKKEQELKKQQQELFAKNLLADIKKQTEKKVKPKKADLSSKFAKTLREQSEQSLRQNLLNEDIKLTGKLSRQAQGVVDKYTALIIQSIGEHWRVPLQATKKIISVFN